MRKGKKSLRSLPSLQTDCGLGGPALTPCSLRGKTHTALLLWGEQARHRPEGELKYAKSMYILNINNSTDICFLFKKKIYIYIYIYIYTYSHFPAELIIYFWFILVPSTDYKINLRSHSPICPHHHVPFRTTSPKQIKEIESLQLLFTATVQGLEQINNRIVSFSFLGTSVTNPACSDLPHL